MCRTREILAENQLERQIKKFVRARSQAKKKRYAQMQGAREGGEEVVEKRGPTGGVCTASSLGGRSTRGDRPIRMGGWNGGPDNRSVSRTYYTRPQQQRPPSLLRESNRPIQRGCKHRAATRNRTAGVRVLIGRLFARA